ncbi:MAG: hypothetical protein SBU_000373 [Candidatus Syntrophoarchaeum butanivorans]|uniref:Uncharacterized protein n=1 Tax=Candidatus Syntropharchaeum butanivorans TaxID=1839936 RepID=A0A1F2P731_9EURY|nr:MAG: hypothetical protein SBU_000373 [Candidatus Syntrophoarchaeum butanivorans]
MYKDGAEGFEMSSITTPCGFFPLVTATALILASFGLKNWALTEGVSIRDIRNKRAISLLFTPLPFL